MREKIYFKGAPMTLVGRPLKIGLPAPDFSVVSAGLKAFGLDDFKGRLRVITTFLSLDTPVCDLQVKEFNQRAADYSAQIALLGISKDLPFAQKRFCQANHIGNVVALSDYLTGSFGINYGLLIKEMNLLARAVLIVDIAGVLRYKQVCVEQTSAPDYKAAYEALSEIVKNPGSSTQSASPIKCKPCEGKVPALSENKIGSLLAARPLWRTVEGRSIARELKFKDFAEAKYFLDSVGIIAEEQGHHPQFVLSYGKLKITLTTYAAGGLTENDFIMAEIIDELSE